ncbi:hypothetical protein H2248_011922 [Termitomyces sp. 'cryptogamus']|nr:hypothetical protein H2248_011922 [Termitomyces sp. 'cryptogamus']
MVVLLRPASRGTVSLASEDPLECPACDLGYFTDPADYDVMCKRIKFTKRIGEKMREHGMRMKDMYMPDGLHLSLMDCINSMAEGHPDDEHVNT